MSLVDHLSELRNRAVRVPHRDPVGSIVGFYFSDDDHRVLAAPAGGKLARTSGRATRSRSRFASSIVIGIVLAMPVLLYQLWAFVAPGLTATERRTVRPWIPLALLFFALGVGIAYFVLPYAMAFLYSFATGTFVNLPCRRAVLRLRHDAVPGFGLLMEFPIVLYALRG